MLSRCPSMEKCKRAAVMEIVMVMMVRCSRFPCCVLSYFSLEFVMEDN